MGKIIVSILVPIYNVEKYIKRCAESIFEQTYQDLEIIFVDDASTDKSIPILHKTLKEFPQRANQVKIITHSFNRGIAAARNTGFESANGDYIFIIDSDDYIETDTISLMVNEAILSKADVIIGNFYIHDNNSVQEIRHTPILEKEKVISNILGLNVLHHVWNNLINTSLIKDNNIKAVERVNYGEDHQIMVQVVYYANKISYIDKLTYHYIRTNSTSYIQSINTSFSEDKVSQILDTAHFILHFFKDKESIYYNQAKSMEFHYYYWVLSLLCLQGKRKTYKKIAKSFQKTDSKYWTLRKWQKPLFRIITSYYPLMRIYLAYKEKQMVNEG